MSLKQIESVEKIWLKQTNQLTAQAKNFWSRPCPHKVGIPGAVFFTPPVSVF